MKGDNNNQNISDMTDRLLSAYRFWGLASVTTFLLFSALLAIYYMLKFNHILFLLMVLLSGFLFIGMTSLCRHALVRLKQHIGVKVGIVEFILTQFVFIMFPFNYARLRREAEGCKKSFKSPDETG